MERAISELQFNRMEGYSDSVILPLLEFSPGAAIEETDPSPRKRPGRPEKAAEVAAMPAVNVDKERVRREKMSGKFSVLQTIVPNLLPKATRENIVTNTIQYVKSLEKEIERLENLKDSPSPSPSPPPQSPCPARPALTHYANRSSSVTVTVTFSGGGSVAFFGIQVAARRRVVSEILRVFGKHEAEVLAATVSNRDEGQQQRMLELTVTAVLGGDADKGERIKVDILNL